MSVGEGSVGEERISEGVVLTFLLILWLCFLSFLGYILYVHKSKIFPIHNWHLSYCYSTSIYFDFVLSLMGLIETLLVVLFFI